MSATETLPAAAAPKRRIFAGRVTQAHVMRSEWTKLWSLRSTRWSLLFAVVAMAGLGVLIAAVSMGRWSHLSLHDRATFDSIDRSLGGYHLAQLAIGVLGVLVISGEYSTGMIRSSLMAVPRRLPVLWAKIAVFASVTFVLMLASAFVAFFGAQAILTEHHVNVTLSHPHALRTLVGTVLFMTVTGILCVALGTIIRSTAGGDRDVRRPAVRPAGDRRYPPEQHRQIDRPLPALERGRGDRTGRPGRAHALAVGRVRAVLRLHDRVAGDRRLSARTPRRLMSTGQPTHTAQRAVTKVPEIALIFWVLKLLTTGMGESMSDFLGQHSVPIAGAIGIFGLWFAIWLQMRQREYRAPFYWFAVMMVAIFGTMAADGIHDGASIPYAVTTPLFAV